MSEVGGSPVATVAVLIGPDGKVDEAWLEEWARETAPSSGVDLTASVAVDDADLLRRLDDHDPSHGLIVATENPAALDHFASMTDVRRVWLGMSLAIGEPPDAMVEAGVQIVRGRGLGALSWALKSLIARSTRPFVAHRYGPHRDQVADLVLPDGDGPHPVVVLIHGGAWRANWERDLMDKMAVDLARRGYATWSIDYRRVGTGGGWPSTFEDVSAGIDALAGAAAPLDLDRVVLLGHSAGGHLALWAAARGEAEVRPVLVISIAGVPDLIEGARRGVYERAVEGLMDGLPGERREEYRAASPAELLPIGTPQLLVHGLLDLADNVDMNRGYAARALAAGDELELVELADSDHFDVIDPGTAAWDDIARLLSERAPSGAATDCSGKRRRP